MLIEFERIHVCCYILGGAKVAMFGLDGVSPHLVSGGNLFRSGRFVPVNCCPQLPPLASAETIFTGEEMFSTNIFKLTLPDKIIS